MKQSQIISEMFNKLLSKFGLLSRNFNKSPRKLNKLLIKVGESTKKFIELPENLNL